MAKQRFVTTKQCLFNLLHRLCCALLSYLCDCDVNRFKRHPAATTNSITVNQHQWVNEWVSEDVADCWAFNAKTLLPDNRQVVILGLDQGFFFFLQEINARICDGNMSVCSWMCDDWLATESRCQTGILNTLDVCRRGQHRRMQLLHMIMRETCEKQNKSNHKQQFADTLMSWKGQTPQMWVYTHTPNSFACPIALFEHLTNI